MTNYVSQNQKNKLKKINFDCKIDSLSRSNLMFTEITPRTQSKIFGKEGGTGCVLGTNFATIEDVMHAIGCDLFGETKYKVTITAEELPNAKKKRPKKESQREAG